MHNLFFNLLGVRVCERRLDCNGKSQSRTTLRFLASSGLSDLLMHASDVLKRTRKNLMKKPSTMPRLNKCPISLPPSRIVACMKFQAVDDGVSQKAIPAS
jgi:hypothetical protein